jgi:hypothetical protein
VGTLGAEAVADELGGDSGELGGSGDEGVARDVSERGAGEGARELEGLLRGGGGGGGVVVGRAAVGGGVALLAEVEGGGVGCDLEQVARMVGLLAGVQGGDAADDV